MTTARTLTITSTFALILAGLACEGTPRSIHDGDNRANGKSDDAGDDASFASHTFALEACWIDFHETLTTSCAGQDDCDEPNARFLAALIDRTTCTRDANDAAVAEMFTLGPDVELEALVGGWRLAATFELEVVVERLHLEPLFEAAFLDRHESALGVLIGAHGRLDGPNFPYERDSERYSSCHETYAAARVAIEQSSEDDPRIIQREVDALDGLATCVEFIGADTAAQHGLEGRYWRSHIEALEVCRWLADTWFEGAAAGGLAPLVAACRADAAELLTDIYIDLG